MIQVYAKADAAGRVEELGSSVFLTDFTGWVQIDEGEGDRYAHAQGNYLEKPLMDADGTHNYILGGSTIREATAAEKEAEKASFPGPEAQPGGTAGSAGCSFAIAGGRIIGGE